MYDDTVPARGAHIAALRAGKLMTQAGLATAAGLHVGTVKRAESGKPLSAETAQALCAVFGLPAIGLSPSSDEVVAPTPVGVALPSPVAVRRSGWSTVARWACACVASLAVVGLIGFEATAWTVVDPAWFRLCQAGAQTCLAVAGSIFVANRLTATRRRTWLAPLAICLTAAVWPTVQVHNSVNTTKGVSWSCGPPWIRNGMHRRPAGR